MVQSDLPQNRVLHAPLELQPPLTEALESRGGDGGVFKKGLMLQFQYGSHGFRFTRFSFSPENPREPNSFH